MASIDIIHNRQVTAPNDLLSRIDKNAPCFYD